MVKTKVIFRKFKDGDIIAIFPEEPGTLQMSTCLSYMHIGQHSSCDVRITRNTLPATLKEYRDLRNELTKLGYNLEIIKKFTPNHYQTRLNKIY